MSLNTTSQIEVIADALAVGGSCICSPTENSNGKKLFVNGLIPGEIALVEIVKEQKNFQEANLLKINSVHKNRVKPPCPYVTRCGGCQLQHMNIEEERKQKMLMIESYFARQAGTKNLKIINSSENLPELHYRRRITLHLSHNGMIGFHRQGTGQVIPIDQCLLAEPEINSVLPKLHEISEKLSFFAKTIEVSNEQGIKFILFLRNQVSFDKLLAESAMLKKILKLGLVFVKDRSSTKQVIGSADKLRYVSSFETHGHFSQVNRAGNDVLHDIVLSKFKNPSNKNITELYAGSGNFTLPLAKLGYILTAVEFDSQLVKAGQKKAESLKLQKNIRFFESSCEHYVRKNPLDEIVILDPPRAGAKDVIKIAKWEKVQSIIYISCNLPSLVRDAVDLSKHGFSCEEISYVDMFPQTHHVEMVAVFSK